MSPEWMIAIDRIYTTVRRPGASRLRDPLEREEWRGLEWVNGLFCRLLDRRRHERPRRDRHQPARRLSNGLLSRSSKISS